MTYYHDRLILHFEYLYCKAKSFCNDARCLQETFSLASGHYRFEALRLTFPAILLVQFGRVIPANGLHVDIDITRRCRAVVHVIGVLIHIEHQDRATASECRGVIGRSLVDEALVTR